MSSQSGFPSLPVLSGGLAVSGLVPTAATRVTPDRMVEFAVTPDVVLFATVVTSGFISISLGLVITLVTLISLVMLLLVVVVVVLALVVLTLVVLTLILLLVARGVITG